MGLLAHRALFLAPWGESLLIGLLYSLKASVPEKEGAQDNTLAMPSYLCELEGKIMFNISIENVLQK